MRLLADAAARLATVAGHFFAEGLFALALLAIPAFCVVSLFLGLAVIPQSAELFYAYLDSREALRLAGPTYIQLWCFSCLVLVYSIEIITRWQISNNVQSRYTRQQARDQRLDHYNWIYFGWAWLLALAPLAAATFLPYLYYFPPDPDSIFSWTREWFVISPQPLPRQLSSRVYYTLIGAFVIGFALLIAVWVLEQKVAGLRRIGLERMEKARSYAVYRMVPATTVFTCLACIVMLFDDQRLQTRLGPFFVLITGTSAGLCILMVISRATARYRFPWIFLAVMAPFVFGAFGWPSNHRLPRVADAPNNTFETFEMPLPLDAGSFRATVGAYLEQKRGMLPLDTRFAKWQDTRLAKGIANAPVFLVALQGGATYAAYHAAVTLARIQDRCPAFANHVFALSGVSGGSLGGAVFVAAVDAVRKWRTRSPNPKNLLSSPSNECVEDPKDTPHERLVKEFFRQDLLTPLVTAGLFLDLPQRFLPFPLCFTDRSIYLDNAIRLAWRQALNRTGLAGVDNFFERGVFALGAGDIDLPSLIFNTTIIESGEPLVISSLPFWSYQQNQSTHAGRIHHLAMLEPDSELSIASAVNLSSRFPIVTPPAKLYNRFQHLNDLPRTLHIADGGYFENSGARILRDLIQSMSARPNPSIPARTELFVITFSHRVPLTYTGTWFAEIMTPFRALMNTRTVRGYDYVNDLTAILPHNRVVTFFLADDNFVPPLAWILSEYTKGQIDDRSGWSGRGFNDNVAVRIASCLENRPICVEPDSTGAPR